MTSKTGAQLTGQARADRLRNDEHILRVAAQLMARDPGVTMRAIADAAGLARPTVYRRYADREALVVGLRAAVDEELERALAGVPAWGVGVDVMSALIEALVRVATRYPVARLRYAPTAGEAPAADARVTAILRAGQRRGRLRDDLAAETLHTALFGVLSAILDGPNVAEPDDAADTIRTLLLSGISCSASADRSDIPPGD